MSDNIDFSKMLDTLAKMDKAELESKLKQAQSILNSNNINTDNLNK